MAERISQLTPSHQRPHFAPVEQSEGVGDAAGVLAILANVVVTDFLLLLDGAVQQGEMGRHFRTDAEVGDEHIFARKLELEVPGDDAFDFANRLVGGTCLKAQIQRLA